MLSTERIKGLAIGLTASIIAVLFVGATGESNERPAQVPSETWIGISDKAGFVVTSEQDSGSIGAELFLKTEQGWRRARIENPMHVYPLSP